eukprot:jgi/Mesvir1/376/Mv11271-RA.2
MSGLAFKRTFYVIVVISLGSLCCAKRVADADGERRDGHGRMPVCRACHRMVLQWEALKHTAEQVAAAEERAAESAIRREAELAKYWEFVETSISTGCSFASVQLDRSVRGDCPSFLDDHQDDIADVYWGWVKKGGKPADINFNKRICYELTKACPYHLSALPVSELEPLDGLLLPGKLQEDGTTGYLSDDAPDEPQATPVITLVASTFLSRAVNVPRDVLLLHAYPTKHVAYTAKCLRVLEEVAALLAPYTKPGGPLMVAQINMERNEAPRPFGNYVQEPLMVLMLDKRKHAPAILANSAKEDPVPAVLDVLQFLGSNTQFPELSEGAHQVYLARFNDVCPSPAVHKRDPRWGYSSGAHGAGVEAGHRYLVILPRLLRGPLRLLHWRDILVKAPWRPLQLGAASQDACPVIGGQEGEEDGGWVIGLAPSPGKAAAPYHRHVHFAL